MLYLIGLINEVIPWEMAFWKQCIIGSFVVTGIEFVSGCIVNLWLGWNVWDYSHLPLNLLGQICLPFFAVVGTCFRYGCDFGRLP